MIQVVLSRGLAFVWYLCDTVLDVRHSSFPGESEVWRARVLSSANESLETEFPSRYPSVTSRAWTISPARVSFTTLDALDTALFDDPGVGTLARFPAGNETCWRALGENREMESSRIQH